MFRLINYFQIYTLGPPNPQLLSTPLRCADSDGTGYPYFGTHSRQANEMTSLNSTSVYKRTHCKNNYNYNESTRGRVVGLDDGGSFVTGAEVRPYKA